MYPLSRFTLICCLLFAFAGPRVSVARGKKKDKQKEKDVRMAKQRAAQFDPKKLQKLEQGELDAVTEKGLLKNKTEIDALIKRCDEGMKIIDKRIRETEDFGKEGGYTKEDIRILNWSWAQVKACLEAVKAGKPLSETEPACVARRNGAMYSGSIGRFKGKAIHAVEIMREIGLKDTANGKRWSELWGHMFRTVKPLGKHESGDPIVSVNVILAVNKIGIIYKQVLNVRTIEQYSEYDLGNGCYVIMQNMVCDGSAGRKPQGYKRKGEKEYYPVVEQLSMTVIRDNKDGTFTLGNFMSTKAQPLKTVTGWFMKVIGGMLDLKKMTEKDTKKNRVKWNDLFQKAVQDKAKQ